MKADLEPEQPVDEGAPAWTVQFADMMSLLLTFFILLFSFSEIDAERYRALSDSFREAFGSARFSGMDTSPQADQLIATESGARNDALLDGLRSIIPQAFPGALPNRYEGHGFLVRIPGELLFETGKDELKPQMMPLLRKMADLLKEQPEVSLRVDGHTDNVPINTVRFQSNWELSAARALAVVHFLVEECGVPMIRVSAAAFGESHPIALNISDEGREKNRRVEFRFVQGAEEANYEISSYPTEPAQPSGAD